MGNEFNHYGLYFTIVKYTVNTFSLYSLGVTRKAQALCTKTISLLQEERKRRKLSKYFVAQESGLSPQMVAYVENGIRNPTLETILRMSEAMNVDLEKIIAKARKQVSTKAK